MILTIYIPERVFDHFERNYDDPRKTIEAVVEAFVAGEEGWEDEGLPEKEEEDLLDALLLEGEGKDVDSSH